MRTKTLRPTPSGPTDLQQRRPAPCGQTSAGSYLADTGHADAVWCRDERDRPTIAHGAHQPGMAAVIDEALGMLNLPGTVWDDGTAVLVSVCLAHGAWPMVLRLDDALQRVHVMSLFPMPVSEQTRRRAAVQLLTSAAAPNSRWVWDPCDRRLALETVVRILRGPGAAAALAASLAGHVCDFERVYPRLVTLVTTLAVTAGTGKGLSS